MKTTISGLSLLLSISFNTCNGQHTISYANSNIVKASELTLTSVKRGIQSKTGMIFIVEKNLRELTAYKNSIQQWRVDVISICGVPALGKPEIRYIRMDGDNIYVVFGKHSFANVGIMTGKVVFIGSD